MNTDTDTKIAELYSGNGPVVITIDYPWAGARSKPPGSRQSPLVITIDLERNVESRTCPMTTCAGRDPASPTTGCDGCPWLYAPVFEVRFDQEGRHGHLANRTLAEVKDFVARILLHELIDTPLELARRAERRARWPSTIARAARSEGGKVVRHHEALDDADAVCPCETCRSQDTDTDVGAR